MKQTDKNSDDDDDVVPFSALMKRKAPLSSEGEDDTVPLASLIVIADGGAMNDPDSER